MELSDQTTFGRRLGTLMYMSPEQLRGEPVDATRRRLRARRHPLRDARRCAVPSRGTPTSQPLYLRRALTLRSRAEQPRVVMKRIAAEPRPMRERSSGTGSAPPSTRCCCARSITAPRNRFGSAGRADAGAGSGARGVEHPHQARRRAEIAAPTRRANAVDLTKVAPQPLTSIDDVTTAHVQKKVPSQRKWRRPDRDLRGHGRRDLFGAREPEIGDPVELIPPAAAPVTPRSRPGDRARRKKGSSSRLRQNRSHLQTVQPPPAKAKVGSAARPEARTRALVGDAPRSGGG